MKVEILVEGEDDIKPFTKIFEYKKSDEFIFFNSIEVIKNKISRNLKLNINETLALFSAFIVVSLNEKKPVKAIQEYASQLVLPNQVLIGVPDLLKKLTFTVTTEQVKDEVIIVKHPIHSESFISSTN